MGTDFLALFGRIVWRRVSTANLENYYVGNDRKEKLLDAREFRHRCLFTGLPTGKQNLNFTESYVLNIVYICFRGYYIMVKVTSTIL